MRPSAAPTTRPSRRSQNAAGSASASGWAGRGRCSEQLGDPQLAVRGALVGGTNGKGSVLALAGSALRAAGLRAGETPKPHLVSYRERLQIGGRPVDAATFARLVSDAIAAADRLPRRLGDADRVRAPHRGRVPLVRRGAGRPRARRGRPRRAARRDPRLGRRRGRDHERRPRPHGPAGPDDRAHRPREGGDHRARRPGRDRRDRRGAGDRRADGRPARGAAHGRRAGAGPGRGSRRARRRPAAPRPDAGRACAAAIRPRTSRLPTRSSMHSPRPASPTSRTTRVAGATREPRGRAGWSSSSVDGRDVLLDGAHNPAGAAALAAALDDLRPFLAPGRAHPPDGVDGRQGRRRDRGSPRRRDSRSPARGSSRRRSTRRAPCRAGRLAAIWMTPARPVRGRRGRARHRRRAGAGPRRAAGPVVVAGSLYLVGAVRARLVDDPLLRDPGDNRSAMTPSTRGQGRRRRPLRQPLSGRRSRRPDPLRIGPTTFAWGGGRT